jgi:hypothetical protein
MMIGFAWIACDSTASAQGQLEVDLELILAVDVSRSMDGDEHRLQRDGYVAAFRHPDLLQAIKSGAFGRIAVVYFEWAGSRHQSVAVPWTIVGNGAEAEAFADALASQPILPEAGTSISASLLFAERIFAVSGTRGQRRAIDISGDGANNDGPPVEPVRQRLIAKGVTINGLPIELALGGAGDLTDYYERHVVGGPRAFAITVGDKAELAAAIHRKLVLEIAWLPTPPVGESFFSADGAPSRPYGRQGHGGSWQTRSVTNSLQMNSDRRLAP